MPPVLGLAGVISSDGKIHPGDRPGHAVLSRFSGSASTGRLCGQVDTSSLRGLPAFPTSHACSTSQFRAHACCSRSCDLLRACASSCSSFSCSLAAESVPERCWIDTSLGVLLQLVSIKLETAYPWLLVLQRHVEQLLRILDIVLVPLCLPLWNSTSLLNLIIL